MNSQIAKGILVLYRPGTADAEDPAFAEALQACEHDPELKRWFDEHCSTYEMLRARFREVPIPEGLKQQILAERKAHTTPFPRRPVLLAAAAVVVVLLGLVALLWPQREPAEVAFTDRLIRTALSGYGMFTTNDPVQVHAFLERNRAPSDYALPAPLQQTALTGCTVTIWETSRVSLICFNSGRPRPPRQETDLWLFVADRDTVPDAPATNQPVIAKRNRVTTARWSEGKRTYLLLADGDEEFIRKFL
jgi:hypothetical protein